MCNQCYGPSRVLIGELEDIIDGSAPGPRFAGRMRPAAAPLLKKDDLAKAVAGNRRSAADMHWGCFDGKNVKASDDVLHLLGLPQGTTPGEEDWANAVAAWQATKGLPSNGILDAATWSAMLKELPTAKFKPLVMPVIVGGKQLGILEKTMPYTAEPRFRNHGARIEMGFRITDWAAVKKAGFADDTGRPPFRWIQTVEFVSVPNAAQTAFIRKHSQVIDPTVLVEKHLDAHPYYWDEETPPGGAAKFLIDKFVNRPAHNHTCYDLIFLDHAAFPNNAASPGHRAYFNFETALVGVNHGNPTKNTILNTFTWGYDLVVTGGKTEVRLNHLGPGITGGSPTFKQILSKQIGDFPHHCYAGAGYSKAAVCK